jgi:hypothetical protein
MKSPKTVQILATYRFHHTPRICFTVKSSRGDEKYNTCFDRDAAHGSCSCPAKAGCYHLDQLRPIAQKYFGSREKPVATFVENGQLLEAVKTVAGDIVKRVPRIITDAEETAAAYYRMSLQEF